MLPPDDGFAKQSIKYKTLNQQANQFANRILEILKTTKAKPNSDGDWIVAVCMSSSSNLITALLAIWTAGAAYMPINPEAPPNRIEHILKESKPVLAIFDESYATPKLFSSVTSVSFEKIQKESSGLSEKNILDESSLSKGKLTSTAIILYTSGSTGVSRGVRLNHQNINNRVHWQLSKYPFSPTEKYCIAKTTLTFVDHVGEVWSSLVGGRSLVVVPKASAKDPERLVAILDQYKIERILTVPTLLRGILMYLKALPINKAKNPLQHTKMWVSSGEALTMQLAHEFFDTFKTEGYTLANYYGSTEILDVSVFEVNSKPHLAWLQKIPIGTPVHNTIIYILDENMSPVDEGEIGEIYCAGAMITEGYINNQEPVKFLSNPMQPSGRECFEIPPAIDTL